MQYRVKSGREHSFGYLAVLRFREQHEMIMFALRRNISIANVANTPGRVCTTLHRLRSTEKFPTVRSVPDLEVTTTPFLNQV